MVKPAISTKDITACGIFAAMIIVISPISLPLVGGVPITLQTFIITLGGLVIGAKRGCIAAAIYVLVGAIGLPVFSNYTGGLSVILGPRGGFIISFPLMAYIVGYFYQLKGNRKFAYLGMVVGTIVNYCFGILVFMMVTNAGFYKAVLVCVIPFIPLTIAKIILATEMGLIIKKRLGNMVL